MSEQPDWSVLEKPPKGAPSGDGPQGIGGWLILPLLGLALTPVIVVATQFADYGTLQENWQYLNGTHKTFVIVEMLVNLLAFVIAPVTLLILASKKLETFPGLYIIWIASVPVIVLLDIVIGYSAFREVFEAEGTPMFDPESRKSLIRSVVQAAIWIPYMMRSERVENTFVN